MSEELHHFNDKELKLECLKLAQQWNKETFQTQSGKYQQALGIVKTGEIFWRFVSGERYSDMKSTLYES